MVISTKLQLIKEVEVSICSSKSKSSTQREFKMEKCKKQIVIFKGKSVNYVVLLNH